MLGNRHLALDTLRQQITALETRPVLQGEESLPARAGFLVAPRGAVVSRLLE